MAFALVGLANGAQAQQAEPAQRAGNVTPSNCVLLLGGPGMKLDDAKVNAVWQQVDRAVSNAASDALLGHGYNVVYAFSVKDTSQEQMTAALQQMTANGCARTIQIARTQSAEGGSRYFTYTALLFHLDKRRTEAGTAYTVAGEYRKDYRYPLTEDTLKTLSLSGLGRQIAGDLEDSTISKDAKRAP